MTIGCGDECCKISMIICICKNVNEKTIQELKDMGYTIKDVRYMTGASTDCGTCFCKLKELMDD